MAISSAGLGSGLDINSLVSGLVQAEKQPLNSLNKKKTTYNNQLSAFGRVKSDLDAFRSALSSLKLNTDFALTKATSSNTTILTATSTSSAVAGSYDIKVSTLAQAGVHASAGKASATAAIGVANFDSGLPGSSTVSFSAAGKSFDISVSDTDTLETVRDKINNAVVGGETSAQSLAKASVINAGTSAAPSYKLVVASTGKGLENDVSISSTDAALNAYFNFSSSQPATNATFTVNGLSIERSTNTVSDVIDGVTLNLASADNTKTLTLAVAQDTEAITKKLNDFVSAYNKLAGTVSSLHQKGGSLEADNSAKSVIYNLQGVFNEPASIAGGNYSWLAEVGISFKKDGTLALDSSAFTKALESNFDGVVSMFTDSTQGFAHRLYNSASNMLTTDGLVDSRISGINARIKTLEGSIDRENVRIENVEKRLRAQFSRLDSYLGTMKNSTGFLNALSR